MLFRSGVGLQAACRHADIGVGDRRTRAVLITKRPRQSPTGPTPWLARRFQGKGESIFISIHMWHTVVVSETRCELVLDCMREPRGVRALRPSSIGRPMRHISDLRSATNRCRTPVVSEHSHMPMTASVRMNCTASMYKE